MYMYLQTAHAAMRRDMPDRGDSMESSESEASTAPASRRRSSIYARSSELLSGAPCKSQSRMSLAQADDTETSPLRKSAEGIREAQGVTSDRHRSQSVGSAFALTPGSSKQATLQALGLVLGTSAHEP